MSSNERARNREFSPHTVPTHGELNTIDINAAVGVNRANTSGGWRIIPMAPMVHLTTAGAVMCSPLSCGVEFSSTAGYAYWGIPGLPHGHTIKGIRVYFLPAGGHAAEPDVLPGVSLYSIGTAGISVLGADTYTWVDTASYEAGFWISSGVLSITIDLNKSYTLRVTAESGANSTSGMYVGIAQINVSCDTSSGGADFTFWI